MVYFTCNYCGGSIKKTAVVKHYATKCQGKTWFLTCMDCQKDFKGNECVDHTKCISEAERYSGKDYTPKAGQNKGQKKQDAWIDIIDSLSTDQSIEMDPKLKNVFHRLKSFENIPRKKVKFQNFVSNSFKIPMPIAMKVWDILEKALDKFKATKAKENAQSNTNGHGEIQDNEDLEENKNTDAKQKKSKKSSKSEETNESQIEAELNDSTKKSKKDKKRNRDSSEVFVADKDNVESAEPSKKKKKKTHNEESLNEIPNNVEPMLTNGTEKKKSKKIKNLSEKNNSNGILENELTNEEMKDTNQVFSWISMINECAIDGMNVEKLKKKVLKKFSKQHPEKEINNKIEKKFKKFLKKSKLIIENDVIKMNS